MSSSPTKQKSTSRVIDDLHSKIDVLTEELDNLKVSHSEHKKRSANLSTKNDSLIDQLANCKHENDMINALLKRKERRIADLEGEFDDMSSETETLRQLAKNYKIRCENLLESSNSLTAEFERLKISYDALMASQMEYKRHYQDQVTSLSKQLEAYKQESANNLNALAQTQQKHEKDHEALFENLTTRNKSMELIYFNKNKAAISALALLANIAKLHGEESKSLLHDNVEIINAAREKYPKLAETLSERSEATVDLDELLRDSEEKLDFQFDNSENSPTEEQNKSANRQNSTRKKRNRRSARMSTDTGEHSGEALPRVRGAARDSSRRSPSSESTQSSSRRTSFQRRLTQNVSAPRGASGNQRPSQTHNTSGQSSGNNSVQKLSYGSGHSWSSQSLDNGSSQNKKNHSYGHNNSNNTSSSNSSAKNPKRRSFYGGSSFYNSGSERKTLGKLDPDA